MFRIRLTPNGILCSVFGALVLSCGSSQGDAKLSTQPNLLFVVFDTTRADHLTPYGYERETAPHVAALAKRGAVFEAARSVSTLTPVSAASFLTGMQPLSTGVRSLFLFRQQALNQGVTTLAERLRESGYATGAFVSAAPMGARYGLDRGFDVYDDDVKEGAKKLQKIKVGNAYQRRADKTTDAALAWLGSLDQDKDPFALLVHYFDAHDPARVPPLEFLKSRVTFELPADLDERGHLAELFDGAEPGRGGARQSDLIELYDAELEYMDQQLGRILDELRASHELENTLIVFLADHGESLGEHDFWTHGLLWDEQLHVPLILAGPGVPKGISVPQTVSLVDLVPTLTVRGGLMGMTLREGEQLDGHSFGALLSLAGQGEAFEQRPVVSEVHNSPEDRTGRPAALFAVTAMPWKLIVEPGARAQLFHLGEDPGELVDLYTEAHPAGRALAAVLLASGCTEAADLPSLEDLTEEERTMLGDLGYF